MEASWSRLGDVLERLGSLGRHVGVLGASWKYLVSDFQAKEVKFRYAILDVILQLIFDGFGLQKSMPEL